MRVPTDAARAEAAHLLRRATFGPTAAEIDAAAVAGPAATVATLLTASGTVADLTLPPITGTGAAGAKERRAQARTLLDWWLARMVTGEHRLTEKMVFFWHGHWATSLQKVRYPGLLLGQLRTFRRYGLGGFDALTRTMLRDPALILWLDGQRNTARAPNENLARELMELFTLGLGAYTEADVKAAARALTGWTVDRRTGVTDFRRKRHDAAEVTILGSTTAHDADTLATLLLAQPAHAPFLAGRLWFRFASGEPMPPEVRDRLVTAYGPGHDVGALMRALLTDPAFAGTRGQLVKQPVEWLAGTVRQLGVDPATLDRMPAWLAELDQVPLRPPSVGGWPAGAAWLTTSATEARLRIGARLAGTAPAVDTIADAPAADRPEAAARLLAIDAWTPRTREVLAPLAGRPRELLALAVASPEHIVQ